MWTGGGSSNSSNKFGSNCVPKSLSPSVYTSDDGIQNGLYIFLLIIPKNVYKKAA